MLNSIFLNTDTNSIEITSLLICSIVSIFLGLIIALTHKHTSKYSKNFLTTIAILPLLVQTVIIMVNGNLGTSIAVMGAFSLVKFRSVPGTSKEILTIFFAMAIGLATGMGQIVFAIIITIIGSLMIFLLNNINLFNTNNKERRLKILISENLDYDNIFEDVFNKFTKKNELTKVKTVNMGSMFELNYNVILKDKVSEKAFIDDLRVRNGNLKITLSQEIDDIDL